MSALSALGAFFVNPWLLGGLALLAAPIIIHLLNKRRYQIVNWAAMDFLLEAVTQNRRRLRLEDLILLLLRMLLLALVILAVARPLLRALQGGREDERLVVLDDSFSMEWNDGTGALFERARALAGSELQEAVGRGIPVKLWRGAAGGPGGSRCAGAGDRHCPGGGSRQWRQAGSLRLLVAWWCASLEPGAALAQWLDRSVPPSTWITWPVM